MSKKSNYDSVYDIFISYRREGGEAMAILLHDRLTAKGYNVFLDVESLNSGKFNSQLLKVIESCKDVIIVLSENSLDRCSNDDDWVRSELAHAFKHKKNIIPFMLRGFTFPDTLPDDISELPMQNGVNANSNEYFDASIERLITKFLESEPTVIGESKKLKPLLVAGVVAACVFVGAIVFVLMSLFSGDIEPTPPTADENGTVTSSPSQTTASDGTDTSTPEILDNDYSENVINQTISAGGLGVVAVKSDGTVISHDINEDLSGWSDIVSVSVGGSHVLGLRSDGTVVAMGSDEYGQCNVEGWEDIISIHASHTYSFGIKRNGTVVAAGIMYQYHAEVLELRDVTMLATGLHHLIALKADGTVEVIGLDSRGEHLVSGWTDIVAVAGEDFFTLGLKSNGEVVGAGENIWENDDGDESPDWVADINDWKDIKAVSLGNNSSRGDIVGVKEGGGIVVSNGKGSSVDVVAGWRDIVAVSMNSTNLVGLRSDGTVVYTMSMRFDDIVELDEWNGIKIPVMGFPHK
jgi:hypothetical protein